MPHMPLASRLANVEGPISYLFVFSVCSIIEVEGKNNLKSGDSLTF